MNKVTNVYKSEDTRSEYNSSIDDDTDELVQLVAISAFDSMD